MLTEKGQGQKEIFIVFLSTNTIIGRGIRFLTRNQYSHVAVSLDQDISSMYSFARYHINSPIRGGFVTEKPIRYLHNDQDVSVKLCKICVDRADYDRIRRDISHFIANREQMIYNTLNALLSLFGRQLAAKDMYTCLEFVTYLLRYPKILTIRELEIKLKQQVVYEGSLRQLLSHEQPLPEDDYFVRRDAIGILSDTVHHIRKVAARVLLT